MKIEKAIEILEGLIPIFSSPKPGDRADAIKLGIEAMKRIQEDRRVNDDLNPYPLPGETKD